MVCPPIDAVSSSASAGPRLLALTLGPLARDAGAEALRFDSDGPGDAAKALADGLIRAKPVHLSKVRLTGGPLKNAQDLTAKYLLELDPDRMMAYYRIHAGLQQKADPYGGWDGAGRQLTGHIAGHHLSAVSYMYLATGDVRFKTRADYLVAEMKVVQDKYGDGYLGAAGQVKTTPRPAPAANSATGATGAAPAAAPRPAADGEFINAREAFAAVSRGEIKSGGFDLNGLWSPWYVLHKTFAGLRDSYRHTGNKTALVLETKFAAWADGILAPLSEAQVQKMLDTEHGGMNEVLADLYADTGDKRWLTLSQKFEHRVFTDALKRHQDNLSGKHGNCQIPKLIGSATRFVYDGDLQDIVASSFFWDRVAQHHSYATGGHGLAEYFGPPDVLSTRVDGRAAESCNVYNMLKLTRRMFSLRPDPLYADFHERALFNHVLASIDDQDGRTSYMVPVGRGVTQEYQDMQRSFTCCVQGNRDGESHALHGDGLYHESADTLRVNLLRPIHRRNVGRPHGGGERQDGDRFPRRGQRDAHAHATVPQGVHRRRAAPGLGGRRIRDQGQRGQDRSASHRDVPRRRCRRSRQPAGQRTGRAPREHVRRREAHVEVGGDTIELALCSRRCIWNPPRTTSGWPPSCGALSCSPETMAGRARDGLEPLRRPRARRFRCSSRIVPSPSGRATGGYGRRRLHGRSKSAGCPPPPRL